MSVSYGGDTITFADNSTISSGWTGFKNKVHNGDMRISQKANGSSSFCDGSVYPVDRFYVYKETSSTANVSVQRSSTAPTGFANSIAITVNTANTSVAVDTQGLVHHVIESEDIIDLQWGTQDAKPVTLSFWIRSSVTGTYYISLSNHPTIVTQCYTTPYTIDQANVWEKKTITIPGSTSGVWYYANNVGIRLRWDLGCGSNYYAASTNQWNSSYKPSFAGRTNFFGTTGATMYITGVQLEKGSSASSFDYRPIATEMQLCQRYYQIVSTCSGRWVASNDVFMAYSFLVPMRAVPTAAISGTVYIENTFGTNPTVSSINYTQSASNNGGLVRLNCSGGTGSMTGGYACMAYTASTTQNAGMGFSAEL